MNTRTAAWLAWSSWALYLALAIPTLLLQFNNGPDSFIAGAFSRSVILAFATTGALIASRRPENRIGWLFCAASLLDAFGELALEYGVYTLVTAPHSFPAGERMAWLGSWVRGFGFSLLVTFLLLLFPNGRLPSPRWRPVAWLAAGNLGFFTIVSALTPSSLDFRLTSIAHNPFGITLAPDLFNLLSAVYFLTTAATVAACAAVVIVRFRQAKGDERQQLKWFTYAAVLAMVVLGALIIGNFLQVTTSYVLGTLLFNLAIVGIPIAVGIAILRYQLYAIDLLIRRTLFYGVLTALGFGVYFLVVGVASMLFQTQSNLAATIVALGIIAVLFFPLRQRLQDLLNRWLPLPQPVMEEELKPTPPPAPPRSGEGSITAPPSPQGKGVEGRGQTDTHLHGRWLFVARAIWVGLAVLGLGLVVLSIPARWNELRHVSPTVVVFPHFRQLSIQDAAALGQLGLSIDFYALYVLALELLPVLFSATLALVIFWRKSDEWMALLVSALLVLGGPPTTSFVPFSLFMSQPEWRLPISFVLGLALSLFLVMFYLFPDGRVVPRWSWPLAVVSPILILGSFSYFLDSIVPLVSSTSWSKIDFIALFSNPRLLWPILFVDVPFYAGISLGMVAQVYRYVRLSNAMQRQQTKWVVFGLAATLLSIIVIAVSVFVWVTQPGLTGLLSILVGLPLAVSFLMVFPLSIGFSILRYRLWDIDVIIRRTLVYGVLIGGLALVYFGSVALLQFMSQALTGPQSNLVVIAITLAIAALFNPVRRRLQDFIDHRFYREKVDFRQAFTAFAHEVRTIIDLPELLRALVHRTTDLLHITHGAVFLWSTDGADETDNGRFRMAEARNVPSGAAALRVDDETLDRLREGQPISQPRDKIFPLLVPLIAPRGNEGKGMIESHSYLVGVLALGPRLSEQNYSREDQALLSGLADQAGTAIYVAQLIEEKRVEAERREESERRLEAYRNSPIGRAEVVARNLIARPETALFELHALAQKAGQDPEVAALLDPLPRLLDTLGATLITGIADGYRYLFSSQSAPELLPVGLRQLTGHLALLEAEHLQGAEEALALYRLCQQALEANSLPQITQLLAALQELAQTSRTAVTDQAKPLFLQLSRGLVELASAAEALHAYERVDTAQDKLAYLASAVERLRRADRLARTELGPADRAIVQRIAESWLAVVTGAMTELQTRARIVCQLLTRHTWQGDIISLALGLRNEGRGAALNLKASLAPAPEYTLLDEMAQVERLASGEETQLELRVRPRLSQGVSQLRARFVILYDDPRGPDQVENFADVVYLLAAEGEFRFIPNPYVVGTPLQTNSPLFFGREDVMAFIQENVAAAHRNNLVLIGQRRTGKTSLLKQLPARLGDDYVPVYLDGQSLALDPGLPNFFFSLAAEIAFALEDRGLQITPPEASDFAEGPASTFERKFLPGVRQAIGRRHLLLLLDEFEELEAAARRGNLDASVFGFLRHLIQHGEKLSVIFCGTHRMEELAADYWSVLFNISLYKHIACLEQPEALRLIQEPVAAYGMQYDDLALDKMWRVTAGHPYFLQLLCHSLVNRHNKSQRNYVTVADVNAAVDEILASGEAHFVYLWTESTREERLVLTALSRMMPLTGQATPVQVTDYLAERGVQLDRRAVGEALHHLALRDTLKAQTGDGAKADAPLGEADAYRWQLGLLGLWVEKYKSLSRVVDEVRE